MRVQASVLTQQLLPDSQSATARTAIDQTARCRWESNVAADEPLFFGSWLSPVAVRQETIQISELPDGDNQICFAGSGF
jgi:hypothetical protein